MQQVRAAWARARAGFTVWEALHRQALQGKLWQLLTNVNVNLDKPMLTSITAGCTGPYFGWFLATHLLEELCIAPWWSGRASITSVLKQQQLPRASIDQHIPASFASSLAAAMHFSTNPLLKAEGLRIWKSWGEASAKGLVDNASANTYGAADSCKFFLAVDISINEGLHDILQRKGKLQASEPQAMHMPCRTLRFWQCASEKL